MREAATLARWLVTWCVAATALSLWGGDARASQRFALVIGVNEGDPSEVRLHYAERDATRVADVLTRLGSVPAENLVVLRGGQAGAVEAALLALRARMALATAASGAQDPPVLIVYYSGHADARALHLDGTHLSFARLRALVGELGAGVSVFVVDACRSGGLTRVKGARPAEPFAITVQDQMMSEGVAIITSAAEGEDAQESDRLRGGIFTHHLLSGLIGAADASQDLRVTLAEAYRYAYAQTVETTTRTRHVQHPTYAFRMKGKRELVLTRIGQARNLGRLQLNEPGSYVLIERFGEGAVAVELDATAKTELVVAPGEYLIRRRDRVALYEAEVAVVAGARSVVDAALMARIPYRQTVRRGARDQAWSVGASFELSAPILPDTGLMWGAAVSAQVDLADVALSLRLRWGHSGQANRALALTQDVVGFDVGALKLFDVVDTPLALGLGLRAGIDGVFQRFDTRGAAPAREVLAGRVSAFLRVEVALTAAATLQLDCGADVYMMTVRQSDGASSLDTPVAPSCGLGLGVVLP